MSQAKRRPNGASSRSALQESSKASTSTTSTRIAQKPATKPNIALLLIYPTILLTGSLFSLLEPHARSAPYSTLTQSHPPDVAPSYFARKSNILNQYFVKILWLWISGAFTLFLLLHPLTGSPFNSRSGFALSRRRAQALLRYTIVTLLWVFTTQWFFGPPLVDRGFRATGGKCQMVMQGELSDEPIEEFFTAAACKLAGGAWAGGHDISGHVFILILGSAFLVFETAPVVMVLLSKGWGAIEEKRLEDQDEVGGSGTLKLGKEGDEREWGLSMGLIAGVVGTALWMLLMTATYFHTWFEKLTGLVVAFSGIGLVYILPLFIPAAESILGRPGI